MLVPAPGAAMDAGANVPVTSVGSPETEKATAELNPPTPVVVSVSGCVVPGFMLNVFEPESVKPGTFRVIKIDFVI